LIFAYFFGRKEEYMTKQQLIEALHQAEGLSKQQAKAVVSTLFDCIGDALAGGQRIEIRGFGSFKLKRYQGYEGRNPRTGKVLKVKAKKLPAFKPAKMLKQRVDVFRRPLAGRGKTVGKASPQREALAAVAE
jgi:integration host factor subunit beta